LREKGCKAGRGKGVRSKKLTSFKRLLEIYGSLDVLEEEKGEKRVGVFWWEISEKAEGGKTD